MLQITDIGLPSFFKPTIVSISTRVSRFLGIAFLIVAPRLCSAQAHVDTALAFLHVREITPNDSPDIRRFILATGLDFPVAWCAAYVSYCLTAASVTSPKTRSARAQSFISRGGVRASWVLRGIRSPKPGWILIWAKGNGPYGHTGFVLSWDGRCGTTIEGNTGPGIYGSQRDGDGVYIRERCIDPGAYFRVVSFTPVTYE